MRSAKKDENLRRKVERQLSAQGRRTATRLHVSGIVKTPKGKRRMAEVRVGSSKFYSPAVALQSTLKNLFDPDLKPQPVTHIDAAMVAYQPPAEVTFHNHSVISAKAFIRRMKLIARGEKYLRCWRARHKYGMFFVYSDRVVLQTWTAVEGFQVQRVPEEGLDCIPPQTSVKKACR